MPVPRANRLRATHVPEGASGSTPGDRQLFQVPPLWPGIAWGHDARCECSWASRHGVMQVKVKSAACTVHIGDREARSPDVVTPPPEVPRADPLLTAVPWTVLLDQLIAVLAEALESEGDGRGTARCGTPGGYNRHWLDGTETCPACREAKRTGVPVALGALRDAA